MIHFRLNYSNYYDVMRSNMYSVNQRPLSLFFSLDQEFALARDKNYLFDLSYMSILNVSGTQCRDFLQGQLSCDINNVTPKTMRQGLMCNLKGRILALLDIFYHRDSLNLLIPKDIFDSTKQYLAKTAMFSNVKLKQNNDLKIYGFYLQNSKDLLPFQRPNPCPKYAMIEGASVNGFHLGDNLFVLLVPEEGHEQFIKPFHINKQWCSSLAWHNLALSFGHLNIYPESRGLFLPHRLDLHQAGYLDFEKGCYKGQEIIARTHYKAKLKHELILSDVTTGESLYSGQKIYNPLDNREIGELIDYAPTGEHSFLTALSILINRTEQVRFQDHHDSVKLHQIKKPLSL